MKINKFSYAPLGNDDGRTAVAKRTQHIFDDHVIADGVRNQAIIILLHGPSGALAHLHRRLKSGLTHDHAVIKRTLCGLLAVAHPAHRERSSASGTSKRRQIGRQEPTGLIFQQRIDANRKITPLGIVRLETNFEERK